MPQHPLVRIVRAHGGIATRDQFRAHGVTGHALTAAVRSGMLVRLRRAWYALPEVDGERRIAIMLGGRLGALSAARSYGWWDGDDDRVHVSWSTHGNIAKPGRAAFSVSDDSASVVRHWRVLREHSETEPWRESPEQTLAQVLLSTERRHAIACADSAIHSGILSRSQVAHVFATMPARVREWERYVDGEPDSGLESIVRTWLIDRQIPFRLHPRIVTVGEVDFIVGRSLIIEADGRASHDKNVNHDHRRDTTSARLGYVTARFGFPLIVHGWFAVERRILTHLELGDHARRVH